MNDDPQLTAQQAKQNLVTLKAAEIAARDEYERWQLSNTYAKSAAEMVEIDLGCRIAERRWLKAKADYDAAIEKAAANG